MATFNANPLRFDNGGVLLIGSDDVLELLPGSALEFTPCVYKNIARLDRGVPQAPRDGDLEPGTIRIRARLGAHATTSLEQQLLAAGTNGLAKEFTIVVKWPDYRGASTGVQFTFATVCFDREKTRVSQGSDFDTVEFEGTYRTAGPTKATY